MPADVQTEARAAQTNRTPHEGLRVFDVLDDIGESGRKKTLSSWSDEFRMTVSSEIGVALTGRAGVYGIEITESILPATSSPQLPSSG
jgi:hypothetical protein